MQHHDPVGDGAQRVRNVLDPDDCVVWLQRCDQIDQSRDFMLGEPARDLIEQKKFGARCDRLGQFQALAVEEPKMTGRFIGVCQQAGPVEHVDR